MQEGKLNPNEGKLKALQAAMAKIEKDFGKGSIMKLISPDQFVPVSYTRLLSPE